MTCSSPHRSFFFSKKKIQLNVFYYFIELNLGKLARSRREPGSRGPKLMCDQFTDLELG